MKIVKFKNGKYGVRSWRVANFWCWSYLDIQEAHYWWGTIKEYVPRYCHGTLEQARKAIQVYKSPKPKKPPFDSGTPIRGKENEN